MYVCVYSYVDRGYQEHTHIIYVCASYYAVLFTWYMFTGFGDVCIQLVKTSSDQQCDLRICGERCCM